MPVASTSTFALTSMYCTHRNRASDTSGISFCVFPSLTLLFRPMTLIYSEADGILRSTRWPWCLVMCKVHPFSLLQPPILGLPWVAEHLRFRGKIPSTSPSFCFLFLFLSSLFDSLSTEPGTGFLGPCLAQAIMFRDRACRSLLIITSRSRHVGRPGTASYRMYV